MKEQYGKGKIKDKTMFRRERESAQEIIQFIEKKLQIENNEELKYTDDANDPSIEVCSYQFEVNFDSIMKVLKDHEEENKIYSKTRSKGEFKEKTVEDFDLNFLITENKRIKEIKNNKHDDKYKKQVNISPITTKEEEIKKNQWWRRKPYDGS
jgi:hypothetical protein